MRLLVRTWNLFHGRTLPETREIHLERMVRLIAEDAPSVVALQEVPVWALGRLERWSGMRAVAVVTMPSLAGPLSRWITSLDPRRVRSGLTGQANALLLGDGLAPAGPPHAIRLNPRSLRRSHPVQGRTGREWRHHRRFCQLVPVTADGVPLRVANLHATTADSLARLELDRLVRLIPEGPAVVCGDFNVAETGLGGFSDPIAGIDQILVRGLELEEPPRRWPAERRRHGRGLLSDHAPVEAVVRVRSRGEWTSTRSERSFRSSPGRRT